MHLYVLLRLFEITFHGCIDKIVCNVSWFLLSVPDFERTYDFRQAM